MKNTRTTLVSKWVSAFRTLAFALPLTLLVSACDAQKPTTGAAGKSSSQGFRWSEPSLTGKIVDAETGLPVKGAFVYGHYATSTGTLAGGSKFGEHVRSFAVETDADGVFKLEAWNTGDRLIQGERRGKFPMISVYKPGYANDQQHKNSIREWDSLTTSLYSVQLNFPAGAIDDTPIDRRASSHPYKLVPVKTELERYTALTDSGDAIMFAGECGWEVYAGLLLAQHNELKNWYQRNFPPQTLTADGYPKSGPDSVLWREKFRFIREVYETLVDRILRSPPNAKCADPREIFKGKR